VNSLERTLILKAGYDHGWEVIVEDKPERVVLASALHRSEVKIEAGVDQRWLLTFQSATLVKELVLQHELQQLAPGTFAGGNEQQLGWLLHNAARLARSLPDAPEVRFEETVARELSASQSLGHTEVEATIRRRVGQGIYRDSLMDYWGGACSVTGIAMPELLRASHAKPWAKCESDADRLNVFNGFLLVAHLDALFDRFLMTFDEIGRAAFSSQITPEIREKLGIQNELHLRWLTHEHQKFLQWHRERLL
jgi:hypothetical protein